MGKFEFENEILYGLSESDLIETGLIHQSRLDDLLVNGSSEILNRERARVNRITNVLWNNFGIVLAFIDNERKIQRSAILDKLKTRLN